MAPCLVNLVINHDGRTLVLMKGPQVQVDGFDYSSEQVLIQFQFQSVGTYCYKSKM